MTPSLLGVSHLGLSVADVDAAVRFWTEVMGFELFAEDPRYRLLLHRGARVAIGLSDHDFAVTGPFDERHVGLDHLALAVGDLEALRSWQQRLTRLGVRHSGVTESGGGHHLNLRAPDNVAIELFVIGVELVAAMGLDEPAAAVAGTH